MLLLPLPKINTMGNEIWKSVVGYEGLYEVSNFGRVKSLERKINKLWNGKEITLINKGRIKNICVDSDGYCVVGFCVNGKSKTLKLHRIISHSFIPNPDNKPQVNHKDGIKTNNSIENLEWCTNKENIRHSFDKLNKYEKGYKIGNLNPVPVLQYTVDGKFVKEYKTRAEAARVIGKNQSDICKSVKSETKTVGGFRWKNKVN